VYGVDLVLRVCRGLIVVSASLLAMLCRVTVASARDVVVTSFDGTPIVTHFYPAAGLTPGARVPTVLEGPGWATRGDTSPDENAGSRIGTANLRDAGYNVVTWDPRGFGGSGGTAMFDSPSYEARDVQALIDYVAAQPEALLDAPGDPRVGMVGSSYGGAIQFAAAAIDPRIDALVPDVAWHSLVQAFDRDGAVKAGQLLNICVDGEVFGLADGITDGLRGPAGVQLGTVDSHFTTMCAEGNVLGTLSAATNAWLTGIGPGALLDQIRAPTLLTQGTVDTLFPPGEAIANYEALRRDGVPVKMLWYCGGHGTCLTPSGDPNLLVSAGLNWLRRWLKRDTTVDTGPAFAWIDDGGVLRSGPDYPLASAGGLSASGSGSLTLLPAVNVTLGSTVVGTPPVGMVEARYHAPSVDSDIVGEPSFTLTYSGFALPTTTFLYAQVVDAAAGRVVGNQVTPIPVVLDGRSHTITRSLEAIALRGRPTSDLRVQLVSSTPIYGSQRAVGTITASSITSTLPMVDANHAAAASATPAPPAPPAPVAALTNPPGGLLHLASPAAGPQGHVLGLLGLGQH
jgi:ABC-2 type transport system ATP-binding protein